MTAAEMEATLAKLVHDAEHAPDGGTETWHIVADAVLVEFLRSLGYDSAMDDYEAIPKWFP